MVIPKFSEKVNASHTLTIDTDFHISLYHVVFEIIHSDIYQIL